MVVANWPIRARDLLLLCYKMISAVTASKSVSTITLLTITSALITPRPLLGKPNLRGRRLKGKGKGVLGARKNARGAQGGREGGRETPARKPLFSPSRLLIMYAKITQLWMTSCQISLAAMRLFKSYFVYCFPFVFLKQEIWSEGPVKKSINAVVRWRKKVATMHAWLVI